MHQRNIYRNPPDFLQLAEQYPLLKPYLTHAESGVTFDFHNQEAQRLLTAALLHRDFGLTIDLPQDRLCPPVPNRLNYILWLQDIFRFVSQQCPDAFSDTVSLLDIGTGASAIYPLLGCSLEQRWRFLATEIDARSRLCALHNVTRNNLQDRIAVLDATNEESIFPTGTVGLDDSTSIEATFKITMCNPPFYRSHQEVLESAEAKELGPNAVCTGADTEMITPGGEVAFVTRMVEESLLLETRCLWYTSMLGKLSSLSEIIHLLRTEKVDNYAITEFVQGRTRRWAIAWSFTDVHLPDSLARISNTTLQSLMPARNTLKQTYNHSLSQESHMRALLEVLRAIDGVHAQRHEPKNDNAVIVTTTAIADTWSRAARRRRMKDEASSASMLVEQTAQLVCQIRVDGGEVAGSVMLEFQWVRGKDRNLFESFMSHVGRKVGIALDDLHSRP